ncbi:[acyl-carrier-protein] S-malonyltransferase [Candidatus Aerophobetes bacterium]|uniref:Malonyl CoA-acyl carrier protein transacylase n=1 Tax=Aerophobetes bacterium TaxID=2030807 RepID=A0A2A4YNC6_UNCAE|nr:MAG: [acyl-carrier-protein] S-malonyltransferase [Candidatus Aerophobetes bacterium]
MSKEIVYLFPGQGAQYVSMGQDFYNTFAEAKDIFDKADEILGYSLSSIIFDGPKQELTKTKYSQLAIFVVSSAIAAAFAKKFPEIKPSICAGLSLGEYTALYMSGKISFKECLLLVQARANHMHEASINNPGGLSVVLGFDEKTIREHIESQGYMLWIANLNCPGQVVISGSHEELEKATLSLKEAGAKRILPLDVSGAFHSGLMKEAQEKLKNKIGNTAFKGSSVQIAMNVPGDFVEDTAHMKDHLIKQVASTTKWEKSIRVIDEKNVAFYIEMGPGRSLCGMNKKIGVKAPSYNLEKIEDLEKILEKIGVCYA